MFSVEELRTAITTLFRGGIGNGYTTDEVEEMLDDIDFTTLYQGIWHAMMTIHAYSLDAKANKKVTYRGPDLFGMNAVYLYEEPVEVSIGPALIDYTVELWLLEDMSVKPVTLISIDGGEAYYSEYRVVKEHDPWHCGLELDLSKILAGFNFMCEQVLTGEYPTYEL